MRTGCTGLCLGHHASFIPHCWRLSQRHPGTAQAVPCRWSIILCACFWHQLVGTLINPWSLRLAYRDWTRQYLTAASCPVLSKQLLAYRWVVPSVWTPIVTVLVLSSLHAWPGSPARACSLILAGLLLWQLIEYSLHRFLFHAHPQGQPAIVAHFLFHGCHHKFPSDPLRLVFPPLPASAIAAGIWAALRLVLSQVGALCAQVPAMPVLCAVSSPACNIAVHCACQRSSALLTLYYQLQIVVVMAWPSLIWPCTPASSACPFLKCMLAMLAGHRTASICRCHCWVLGL